MARRRESVFDILLILPWWVGLASGAIGYVAVTYVLPRLWTDQMLGAVAKGIQPVGTFWLVLCVVAAIGSAVRSIFIARKYDRLKSAEDVRSLSWRQFESIVGEAFRRRGYTVLENAVDGPDGGVDLVLRKNGEKFYVQCKQWKKSSVGVKPIRELFGVISASEAVGGFFVCSGSYTEDAKAFAKQSGIELIDGAGLQRMIEAARAPEPFLDPTESRRRTAATISAPSAPSCPMCGEGMVERVAKRGVNAGSKFWGCEAYPKCRGTRAL